METRKGGIAITRLTRRALVSFAVRTFLVISNNKYSVYLPNEFCLRRKHMKRHPFGSARSMHEKLEMTYR